MPNHNQPGFFATEAVPEEKKFHISTRFNSDYKWQTSPEIIGCLEVPSEPALLLDAKYIPRPVLSVSRDAFDYCLEIWEEWNLKDSFLQACEDAPKVTCCCGLLANDDATIQAMVPYLNKTWIREINQRLLRDNKGFKLDCYIWNWHNATGKAETNILLIRFYEYELGAAAAAAGREDTTFG